MTAATAAEREFYGATPSAGPAVRCAALTKDFGAGETRTQVLRGVECEVRIRLPCD